MCARKDTFFFLSCSDGSVTWEGHSFAIRLFIVVYLIDDLEISVPHRQSPLRHVAL